MLNLLKKTKLVRLFRLAAVQREIGFLDLCKLNYLPRYRKSRIQLRNHAITLVDAPSFLASFKEIFIDRIYDFPSTNGTPYIIDAGANVGLASIAAAFKYPGARIVAIEPDPEICNVLRQNLSSCGVAHATVVEAAACDYEGFVSFRSEGGTSGRIDHASEGSQVKAVRLKDFLTDPVDFLKIDIEGGERAVLADCASSLHRVKRLFVEYHDFKDQPQELDDLLRILKSAGFRYQIHCCFSSPKPFTKIRFNDSMDLQLNIFAQREKSFG